jgi:hypothetical protein
MTTHAMCAAERTTPPYRRSAARRAPANPATLNAVMLFLAMLIAEAVFLVFYAPSVADLGALAAVAASVP